MSSFWRAAGISYLQYLNQSTSLARSLVKPEKAAKYAIRENFHFNHTVWENRAIVSQKLLSTIVKQ